MFVFFDYEAIICPSCLDIFLEFCEELKMYNEFYKSLHIFGVVGYREIFNEKYNVRILKKQLKGFVKANNICFPIIIDSLNIFNNPKKRNYSILYLDYSRNLEKTWKIPKSSDETQIIFYYLTGSFEKKD